MYLFFLALICYELPGDTNIYAGMDYNISQFSRYWEWVYETSPSGFRTSQGCIDLEGWYMIYEAKTEAAFNDIFSLRYHFFMLRDYDEQATVHRFEPTMRLAGDFYAHLVVEPYMMKEEDEVGVGLSWRRKHTDWIAAYATMKYFDHNFALERTRPGPDRDPYRQIPFKFVIDARGEREWFRVRFHAELGTQANQYLDWPDSLIYVWDETRDTASAWGRLELQPVKNLWMGTRLGWRRRRSEMQWLGLNAVTFDTLNSFWMEPFLSFFVTDRLELRAEYRFWDIHRDMDSVSYYNDSDIISTLASWQPLSWLLIEGGFQMSSRTRYNNDTTILEPWKGPPGKPQPRLLFNLELRFKSGMMLTIKEGLEMNRFPYGLFSSPHNHTFISLYMPLVLPRKD